MTEVSGWSVTPHPPTLHPLVSRVLIVLLPGHTADHTALVQRPSDLVSSTFPQSHGDTQHTHLATFIMFHTDTRLSDLAMVNCITVPQTNFPP